MDFDKEIETKKLNEKELDNLIENKNKYFTHNIFLICIYLVLIVLSLFIV